MRLSPLFLCCLLACADSSAGPSKDPDSPTDTDPDPVSSDDRDTGTTTTKRDAGTDANVRDAAAPAVTDATLADAKVDPPETRDGVTLEGNPFAGATMYVNPDYTASVEDAIKATSDATLKGKMDKVKMMSTAIWLDRISAVELVDKHLDLALQQPDSVTVFVVYDLPERDCAAKSSAGELKAADAQRYKSEFIDPIAKAFAAHASQRIVAIIEPDSLPNLATNLSIQKCAQAVDLYKSSVAYAIEKLALPNVALYLDAAHSGWIGWTDNQTKTAAIFKEVLMMAGGVDKLRGFATNVSNYTPLVHGTEKYDLQGNPCPDELTLHTQFSAALAAQGITDKGFIIDTSRNGKGGIRSDWGSWCNVKGAGLGERPRADPMPGIDAYYWVKPPGEADGTSDSSAARYDSSCSSADSLTPAPEAGTWFQAHFEQLVSNATPAL